jgi:ABC-type transport system involved in multi-copper enzyme maturation permease subunit
MRERLRALFLKETRQITRSRRTIVAAALVPALMLIFVAYADIVTLKLGFGSKPIYLLSSDHPVSGTYLLRHFSLPVLVTISALVTPSIIMGDVLLGERERRTLELLVALPVSAADVVLAKLAAVLAFAVSVAAPLFVLNSLIVSAYGYSSPSQTAGLAELMLASIVYSVSSALLVVLIAGEPRAANIVSGLVLGPVVPVEGVILAAVGGQGAITFCAAALAVLAVLLLLWSSRMLSFERLFGAS